MGARDERSRRIESLSQLLTRLCSPDLTLGEAKALRAQMLCLLERPGGVAVPGNKNLPPPLVTQHRADGPIAAIAGPSGPSMRVAS